jgi:hypothetical protein
MQPMTVWQIIGLVLLPLAWMALAGANKAHKEQTGVSMPTRSALKSMRRRARKKGVSEAEYYSGWLQRKQKKAGIQTGSSGYFSTQSGPVSAVPVPKKATPPERPRAPAHKPFAFDHLSMMAESFGWTLRKQAFGLYYLTDKDGTAIVNPYAQADGISTDFSHQDVEDFLLTC